MTNTHPESNSAPVSASKRAENLYAAGLVLVVLSSLIHFITKHPAGAWILALSGGLTALSMMIKGAFEPRRSTGVRTRRLDRMRLVGGLLFLTAGGFAIEGQNLWILLFAGGTVFTLYGIFVTEKKPKL